MKEMNIAYLSSAYLAPVEYYTKLLAYDKVFVEQYDHYIKQTYRNRCTIAGPSGELALSIPTVTPSNRPTTILLSSNTTRMTSALSMKRNTSF